MFDKVEKKTGKKKESSENLILMAIHVALQMQ